MTREQLHILKRCEDAITARQQAEKEYDPFFAEFHQYITRSVHVILREIYALYGQVGCLVRVDIEAPEDKLLEIKQWTEKHIRSDESAP